MRLPPMPEHDADDEGPDEDQLDALIEASYERQAPRRPQPDTLTGMSGR